MRLFIAINFDSGVKAGLLALADELRACSRRGNFSRPDNLHLTLVFLGECDARQAGVVEAVMDEVSFTPFELCVDHIGRFKAGDSRRAAPSALWWAGVRESRPLLDLQRALAGRLAVAGFDLEKRRYSPHITLGRQVVTNATPWPVEPFRQTVQTIDLMKSERIDGELTYTAIYRSLALAF